MDAIRPRYVPAGVITRLVVLVRQWSQWQAGDLMELEAGQAGRVIAKGYGTEYHEPKPLEVPGTPPIEVAMLTPPGEMATTGPQAAKRKPKNGARAPKAPEMMPPDKES